MKRQILFLLLILTSLISCKTDAKTTANRVGAPENDNQTALIEEADRQAEAAKKAVETQLKKAAQSEPQLIMESNTTSETTVLTPTDAKASKSNEIKKEVVKETEKVIQTQVSNTKDAIVLENNNELSKSKMKEFIEKNKDLLQKEVEKESTETNTKIKEKATPSKETPVVDTPPIQEQKPEKEIPVSKPDHGLFNSILNANVTNGRVDYASIKQSIGQLDAYLKQLEESTFDSSWSRADKLVYWINAYNAYTIKLIINNYGVSSITDINGGKPWDKQWINLQGKTYSLNNIENDIIRPKYQEPRIHFAVNCAAKSCPPIANQAFTVSNLESLLERQTKSFINNSTHNQISASKAIVSKIFEWYAEDFGDLKTFLNKYSKVQINAKSNVEFNEYDWALNGK